MTGSHEYCALVLAHQETVGALKEGMTTVKDQQKKLFDLTESLIGSSAENAAGIIAIEDKLDNGINKVLAQMSVDIASVVKTSKPEAKIGSILTPEAVSTLNENSWIIKLLGCSIRKLVGWIFMAVLLGGLAIALVTNLIWAQGKMRYFKELPGQQQEIVRSIYHTHTLSSGNLLIHANDPNLPAYEIDSVTRKTIPRPGSRLDDPR